MPRFNNETRKKRIQKLISDLEKGLEVARRDFRNAVGKDYADLYKQSWTEQLELRELKPPPSVKEYEQMLQEALMWHGRLDAYSGRTQKTSKIIVDRNKKMSDMKNKTDGLFERTYEKLQEVIGADKSLAIWFDRAIDFSFNTHLGIDPSRMPRVITSKSLDNQVDGALAKVFGWKSKAELKLEILQSALEALNKQDRSSKEIEAELKQSQQQAEKLKGMLAALKKKG